jgi:hypothetical protein
VTRAAACEIQDARLADADSILALQKLAYESEARRYDDWTIPPLVETLEGLRSQIGRHVVLKAVVDGRLAGSVRGVVIGSALIAAVEARFPDIEAFELFTGNRSVENLRLYDRHGYRHSGTRVLSPAVSLIFLRKPGPSRRPDAQYAPPT